MKFAKIIAAAGLAVAAVTASTAAEAQNWRDRGGYEHRYDHRWDHRYDRGHHYGWDRGRYYRGHRYGWNRHCDTFWRHHRRVTVCR